MNVASKLDKICSTINKFNFNDASLEIKVLSKIDKVIVGISNNFSTENNDHYLVQTRLLKKLGNLKKSIKKGKKSIEKGKAIDDLTKISDKISNIAKESPEALPKVFKDSSLPQSPGICYDQGHCFSAEGISLWHTGINQTTPSLPETIYAENGNLLPQTFEILQELEHAIYDEAHTALDTTQELHFSLDQTIDGLERVISAQVRAFESFMG